MLQPHSPNPIDVDNHRSVGLAFVDFGRVRSTQQDYQRRPPMWSLPASKVVEAMANLLHRTIDKLRRVVLSSTIRVDDVEVRRLGSPYGGWVVPASVLEGDGWALLAGVGEDTSLEDALLRHSSLRLVSVDPTPRAIEHMRRQATDARWEFEPVGLWSDRGKLRLYAPKNEAHVSHSIVNLQQTDRYFEAECVTPADLAEIHGGEQLRLVKLDIEGAEFAVLASLTSSDLHPEVLCVEFDQPCSIRRIHRERRRLLELGYRCVAVDGWNLTFQAPHLCQTSTTRSAAWEADT
ncbi:MAG: FkbM family methyltransferase [Actinomycetota bacterium]